MDAELARWLEVREQEREAELELEEAYWRGFDDGLARAREQQEPERDPDFLYFGPDGRLIESASESSESSG